MTTAKRALLRDLHARELQEILAAERAGLPFLAWKGPDEELHVLRLEQDQERLTIGRDDDADVQLSSDVQVSRVHAVLERVGSEWTLVDDGLSRNGSFVNATRVVGRRRLAHGDRLCLGTTELFYWAGTAAGAASTASVRDHPGKINLSTVQRLVLIALCRPVHDSASATPATNRAIAAELYLSVDAVKAHLRVLFERFGLSELPQNEKRARLVATVLVSGLLQPHDF